MSTNLIQDKLDIVTVGFSPELNLLKLQARSLNKNFSHNDIGTIHVIINEKDPYFFKTYFYENIIPEYGDLAGKVRLYSYPDITNRRLKKIGWRSQQILKLMAHSVVGTENYLILDCKNHFIRPVSFRNFVAEDGRLICRQYKVTNYFWRQYELACKFLGLSVSPKHDYALPTVTPFLMKTQIAGDLITEVSAISKQHFIDTFMKEGFTEFYLYYAYMLKRFLTIDAFYKNNQRTSVSLLASHSGNIDKIEQAVACTEGNAINCFGVHRHIVSEGMVCEREIIKNVWLKHNLVKTRTEAGLFFEIPETKRQKRFWIF